MSDATEQTKRASIAAVTEMHEKAGQPAGELSKLLVGGATDGDQVLVPFGGQAACYARDDGSLGAISTSGERGLSRDGGRSWQMLDRITFPDPPSSFEGAAGGGFLGYNGPAGVVKMADGRLGMTWVQSYAMGRNHDKFDFYFRTSSDEGETWSDDVLVNIAADKGAPFYDTLRQLDSGRLIQPVRWLFWGGAHNVGYATATVDGEIVDHEGHLHHPEFEPAYCYFGDDDGTTWSRSQADILGYVQDGWGNYVSMDEPTLEQLPDGRLLLLARSSLGRLMRCFSEDGGEKCIVDPKNWTTEMGYYR